MTKADKTLHGAAAVAIVALLAACQPKTDVADKPTAAADASQAVAPAAAPTAATAPAGESEGQTEAATSADDDRTHGPRAGMGMGREAREHGMGMAPNPPPPAGKATP